VSVPALYIVVQEENDEYVFLAMEQCAGTMQSLIKSSRAQADVFARLYANPVRVPTPETRGTANGAPIVAPPGQHPMVAHQTPVELVRVTPTLFTLGILRAVFQGVAYLHAVHVVHNDLKPANVLLTEDYTYARTLDVVVVGGVATLLTSRHAR